MTYHSPNKYYRIILAVIALTVMAACGQKGDLYLPEGQQPTVRDQTPDA